MLPPNVIGSINNLSRAGILDYDTAAYVTNNPFRSSYYYPMGMENCPCDSYLGSTSPFGNTPYERRNFWDNVIKLGTVLGALYLGGKVFLYSAKGAKSFSLKNMFSSKGAKDAEHLEKEVKKGWKRFFKSAKSKINNAAEEVRNGAESVSEKVSEAVSEPKVKKVSSFFKSIKDKISSAWPKVQENFSGFTRRIYKKGKFRPGI